MSSATTPFIRHGFGAVRPYFFGHPDLLEFVKTVFGAEELELHEMGEGFHAEVKIGDSVMVLETGIGGSPEFRTRGSVYVYVDDVDAAYQRAIALGATSLREPADQPYEDRTAGVKDSFGNIWWIGTYIGSH